MVDEDMKAPDFGTQTKPRPETTRSKRQSAATEQELLAKH